MIVSFIVYRLLMCGDNEDIEGVQTVGAIVAGQVKQKRAGCGGNSLHRCCCFQRQNGELRNANGP